MTAPAELLTPAQVLYRAEKARKIERDLPAIEASRAELQRQLDAAADARKGGRPRGGGGGFVVGRQGRPPRTGRVVILDEMPGRPDRLDLPAALPTVRIPSSSPRVLPMATTDDSPRIATECGHETPRRAGPTPKLCDDCKPAKGSAAPPRKSKTETPKKRVKTGYRSESPRAAVGGISGAIAALTLELEEIDARREKVAGALVQLQEIADA